MIQDKQWKIVTITYHGRSGSVFLSSLLDSHPNIMLIPGTYIYGFHRPLLGRELISKKEINEIYGELFNLFSDANYQITKDTPIGLLAGTTPGKELCFDQMGINRDEKLSIDRDKFLSCFNSLLGPEESISVKTLFLAVHIAYQVALGMTLEEIYAKKSVIVYQLHTRDDAVIETLTRDFGPIYQIQMVREPIQALGSHIKRYKDYKSKISALGLIKSYCWTGNLSYIGEGNSSKIDYNPDFYKAVKLEDLHTNLEDTMKRICKWIDIDYHNNLLKSTFDDMQWWNVLGSEVVSGANKITIGKEHKDIFSMLDRFRLKYLMRYKYISWKYPLSKIYYSLLCLLIVLPTLLFPYRFIKYKRDEKISYFQEYLNFIEFFLYYEKCTLLRNKNKNIVPLV